MATLQGPVICSAVGAKQVSGYAVPTNGSLMRNTFCKSGFSQSTNISLIETRGYELRQCSSFQFGNGLNHHVKNSGRRPVGKVNAFLDWPLMAVLVEHIPYQRDIITHKSIWHLSDDDIKSVYMFYMMFTCWGCCFFGATKDPYYDSEEYRKDGGDGSGHWVYEKQEDIEESARAALWREELIEEIEQKVGGLRELEEAARKEELVK